MASIELSGSEREAHDRILRWCHAGNKRKGPPACHPVMRVRPSGACAVIDLGRSEPKPGGYDWETRDVIMAEAGTWSLALSMLSQDGHNVYEVSKP